MGAAGRRRGEPRRAHEAQERAKATIRRLRRERDRLKQEAAQNRARAAQPRRHPKARRSHPSFFSPADRESFARLSAQLGGQQGLAVSLLGRNQRAERMGGLRGGVAWSTAKVPIAEAIFASGQAAATKADLRQAITASDNAAALRLWRVLGDGATAAQKATVQLRQAGDATTVIEDKPLRGPAYTPFGQTQWNLGAQARYVAGLECSPAGRQVSELMRHTVSSQRWGLGSLAGTSALKGGWGPGSQPGVAGGYFDRQMGIVNVHGVSVAIALASLPAAGTHEAGISNLNALARWLPAHLHVPRSHRVTC